MRTECLSYLFVYGTLRTEFKHPVKREIMDDVEWVGETSIRARLYDIGRYPGAVAVDDDKRVFVKGEILSLKHPKKVLRILDQYEGFDSEQIERCEYRRDQLVIRLPDGSNENAWIYWYNLPVSGKRRIRHRDYVEYVRKKNGL